MFTSSYGCWRWLKKLSNDGWSEISKYQQTIGWSLETYTLLLEWKTDAVCAVGEAHVPQQTELHWVTAVKQLLFFFCILNDYWIKKNWGCCTANKCQSSQSVAEWLKSYSTFSVLKEDPLYNNKAETMQNKLITTTIPRQRELGWTWRPYRVWTASLIL